MANDGRGFSLEGMLVNIGVGLVAAAFGAFVGVKVHTSQIEEINRRLKRLEDGQDSLLRHFAIKGIERDE